MPTKPTNLFIIYKVIKSLQNILTKLPDLYGFVLQSLYGPFEVQNSVVALLPMEGQKSL